MSEPIPEKPSLNQQDDSKYKLKQQIDVVHEGKKPFDEEEEIIWKWRTKSGSLTYLIKNSTMMRFGNMILPL